MANCESMKYCSLLPMYSCCTICSTWKTMGRHELEKGHNQLITFSSHLVSLEWRSELKYWNFNQVLLFPASVFYWPQCMFYQKSTFPLILRVHFGLVTTSLVAREPLVATMKNLTRSPPEKTDWGRISITRLDFKEASNLLWWSNTTFS